MIDHFRSIAVDSSTTCHVDFHAVEVERSRTAHERAYKPCAGHILHALDLPVTVPALRPHKKGHRHSNAARRNETTSVRWR